MSGAIGGGGPVSLLERGVDDHVRVHGRRQLKDLITVSNVYSRPRHTPHFGWPCQVRRGHLTATSLRLPDNLPTEEATSADDKKLTRSDATAVVDTQKCSSPPIFRCPV